MRVSDSERERAAQDIREHYAAGRLTEEELSERVSAAYRARTADELAAVTSDLPKLPATPAQQRAELAERRAQLRRRLIQQTGASLGVFFICTVIWLLSGAGEFWPVWVAIFPALTLVRNGWRLYGPAPELDRVEAELAARERRHGRSGRHSGHRHRHSGRGSHRY